MRRKLAGFTLLELLIGMVLLGFILTLLFGALRLGAKSWDSGDKRNEESMQLRAVHGFLRRELSQVFLLLWKKELENRLAFEGDSQALKFVAPLSGAAGSGLYLLGLDVEKVEQGQRLRLTRLADPLAKDFLGLAQGDSSVLAEHIATLRFSYFGALSAQGKADWLDKWDDPQRLPRLVRLQVKLDDGRQWPDLVVPLVADRGCSIWDPIHRRCLR